MSKKLALLSLVLVFSFAFTFFLNDNVNANTENAPVIIVSEQETIQLGEQKKLELQKLYHDFLTYSKSSLIFMCSQEYFEYDGLIYLEIFSSEFQSYSDLYNYFLNFCTPEYSTSLLANSRNYYRDIDGKLYLTDTMLSDGTISFASSRIDSYEINGDYIIFNCTGLSDDAFALDYNPDNPVHHPEYDVEITFTLKNIDGNWFIDSCSNLDVFTLM